MKEAKGLLVVAILCFVRVFCMDEDTRTSCVCPDGVNAENVRKILERDPYWHCKPRDELVKAYLDPTQFALPGTPEWGRPPWARPHK
mmetsp:Transcript_23080/g.71890  ORF Transcript_23080/g.71890 Transcript_23080/m.71890 type:complete len:87 (-) Transcript_23080:2090-2350(-)